MSIEMAERRQYCMEKAHELVQDSRELKELIKKSPSKRLTTEVFDYHFEKALDHVAFVIACLTTEEKE